jgi:hypothetical protein
MPSLIETLISGAVVRQDKASLTVIRRPPPTRLRHVLEIFAAMGSAASFQGLRRAFDLRDADPQTMVFAVLGRWPTSEDLAAVKQKSEYAAADHLLALMQSHEFRSQVPRRTCDAFPERRRLLFIRIPSSTGTRVMATLDSKHPVLPLGLATSRFDNPAKLAKTLGHVCGRMNTSNSLALVQPTMAAFTAYPAVDPAAKDPLNWFGGTTPCRTDDLMFALIRDPTERALAYVNGAVAAFRAGDRPIPPAIQHQAQLPPGRAPDQLTALEWQSIARALLAKTLLKNPICHALGDGTAAGAIAACKRVPVHLVPPDQFGIWGRSALDTIPPEPPPPVEPVLGMDDLTQADRAAIDHATTEDRIVHDLVLRRVKAAGLPATLGRDI